MGYVYHGSKEHNIKKISPRQSSHGNYVYATTDKVLAVHFSGRSGDDLTYDIGHFTNSNNEPWQLIENIPHALEKMYANSSSVYSLLDTTFKDIHTGFEEVVSEVEVDVINEEYYENVYDAILEFERQGLLEIYRYPNKPLGFEQDGSYILDKMRFYKNYLNKELDKNAFDRLIYLHPSLMEKINALAKEFNYDYHYKPEDLIKIFEDRINRQLRNKENEQYIESSYISICNAFPELKPIIDDLYENYQTAIVNDKIK